MRRRATHRSSALLVAATLLVACSTQESSTPRATLPAPATSASPSTTATTTPPTSTDSTTTTAAPTTTGTTTTTTSLPAAPAATSIPMVVGGEADGWLFLGAWQVDEWRSAFDDDGTPVEIDLTGRGGDPLFTVSRLGTAVTEARVGSDVVACEQGAVELRGPTVDIDIEAPEPPGFGYAAIALPAADRVLKPRPIAVVPGGAPVYQDLGEAAVGGEPVDGSLGSVEQTVVADLDGDGDDEALVAYEFVQPSVLGTPGDFAALLLVDTETRASSTVERSVVGPDDGDDTTFDVLNRFRVLDVLDLNGDGRMEVVVHGWYYEGAGVAVYEYDGSELTEVLRTGCGS